MVESFTTPHGLVTIRTATEEDAPAYRELRLEALHNHPEAFGDDYESNLTKPASFWIERMQVNRGDRMVMTYFAVHDQDLIGTCSIVRTNAPKARHRADLVGMYVRPDWRGFHIAASLVNASMERARNSGITIVTLAVVTTNARAIRCYARCGFRVYGIEPQALYWDSVYYDELLMARPT